MIVDERRERFDSVTITLVVTSVVIWGLLNWPYSYVSTAHRYEQPPSLTEYSIETFLFAKYEVLQGGFPFTYLTRYEDDLPSRPTFWSPQRLGANIAIAILATLSVGAIAFFLRRLLEKSNGVQTPSRACRLSSRVGIACVTLVILTLLVVALRTPSDTFRVDQLWVYVLAQGAWLLLDLYRAQVAFWKPPVTPVTEPSQTGRAGSSR